MKSITILSILLFILVGVLACGNYSDEKTDVSISEQNQKAFMQALALEEIGIPGDQPLTKCWAESGGKCCYAAGMVASCSDIGGASCEGTTTGSAEGEEGCAALAKTYNQAQD